MSRPTNITDDFWSNTGQMLDEPLDERCYRGDGRNVTFRDDGDLIDRIPSPPTQTYINTEASDTASLECRPLIKEYGERWDWDAESNDYMRFNHHGVKMLYADYQTAGIIIPRFPAAPGTTLPTSIPSRHPLPDPWVESSSRARHHETAPLEPFSVILKPKRFFCVGRIFKAVWFEASSSGEAVARYRWFVVVRRRAQQSLCFRITTFNVQRSLLARAPREVRSDYVVLHSANIEPPPPYEVEGITRDPIAVIIEGREQFIAPIARLDCGRVFTVEDNMKVMKVGRVHPGSIGLLEEYYRECVL